MEWIGEVPGHWEITKIGYFARVGNGSTPNRGYTPYWKNGNIPWLNSSKVNDVNIINANQFITPLAVKECHLPILSPGTIVMAIYRRRKTRGMVALCKIEATINQHLAYIEIKARP
ncbi:MAG: restriction endonuclease subunit S [Lewinellaceae bacterium]|nr:restriction endonuclease subunit S [Lewinellaceae bacterium]